MNPLLFMDVATLVVLLLIVIFLVVPMVLMHFSGWGVAADEDCPGPRTLDGGHPCPYWGMLDQDLFDFEVRTDVPLTERTWQSHEDFLNRKLKETPHARQY